MRQQVNNVILSLFHAKNAFRDIGVNDDYFDRGVSSLTIIGLQIEVEERLGVVMDTTDLMGFSTINQWVDAYADKMSNLVHTSAKRIPQE
jgi:acyl carrier protein